MNLDVEELGRWSARLAPRDEPPPDEDGDGWPEGLGLPPEAGRLEPIEPLSPAAMAAIDAKIAAGQRGT
ncbi:hypothetical protein RUR49_19080 [Pseudoxanthobacter sp. M-2]|uniref:hypothetical protein n=1 Tax=Pseudoxanthobacter sp. M-2 TaxID=3078754 RepID=UPI0038FCACD6